MTSAKRIPLVLIAVIVAALVFAASAKAAESPETITMSVPQGVTAKKSPVLFSHPAHDKAELKCTACHHTWDTVSDIKKCSSSGCHDDFKAKKGQHSYYAAFHGKSEQSCMGCHKAQNKNGRTAPTKCTQCHPKNEAQ